MNCFKNNRDSVIGRKPFLNMKTSLIFLLGLGMGTALGILIAPEAGRITRRKIREEADRMIDRALAKKQLKELAKSPDVSIIREEERYTI